MTSDEQLTVDLWLLDAVLTGEDSRSGRGDPNTIVDLEEFIFGELFYLSDGGYSRVYHSLMDRAICLASESRDDVKTAWGSQAALRIRRRLQATVDKWITDQEGREAAIQP